jgi:hypothetical protein
MFRNGRAGGIVGAGLLFIIFSLAWLARPVSVTDPDNGRVLALQTEPVPTVDPLAIPELPEDPTQVDIGRVSYYYNCMPCHGDQGQGLTDAWRETWVEDHQDCWARGCHAGKRGDEGFPLPQTIPAVAGTAGALAHFSSPASLHDYLQQTHPPQRPGALTEEDYWALTAFLLVKNGGLSPDVNLGAETAAAGGAAPFRGPALALAVIVGMLLIWGWGRSSRSVDSG